MGGGVCTITVRWQFLPDVPHARNTRLPVGNNLLRCHACRDIANLCNSAFVTPPELAVTEDFILYFNNDRHISSGWLAT